VWKTSAKSLIEKKKPESGPKLRLGTGLVPIRDQGRKKFSTGWELHPQHVPVPQYLLAYYPTLCGPGGWPGITNPDSFKLSSIEQGSFTNLITQNSTEGAPGS